MRDDGATPDPAARPDLHGPLDAGSGADRLWWFHDAREPSPPVRRARWRSMRRQWTLDAAACLAVSTLCFSQARLEVLFLADRGFYHEVPLGGPMLAALVLNIAGLAAVGFLGVQGIRRLRRPAGRRLAAGAAAAALLLALNFARIAHPHLDFATAVAGPPGVAALAVLALAAALAWPHRALRAVRGLALAASPLAIVTLAHALWMCLEAAAGPVWYTVDPEPLGRTPPSLRRVVWLVLEELDQRLVFEARPAGLELPELDRLRRESLYADGAHPPAGIPEVSLPALTTGRAVVSVAPVSPNDLELTFSDGKTARWGSYPNVFSRARVLGYDTAVVGWDLPYPRVLGGSLGAAAFRPSVAHERARGATLGQTFLSQWGTLVPPLNARRLRSRRVAELGDLAFRAVADARFALVLLHLPVPGSPGIYDRATGRLTAWNFGGAGGGYLDNLALADRVIEELRHAIERVRLGDRTWLVVTGDRWWAGARAYDGQVDHRVPFLVRPPDGGQAIHVDAPLGTLAAHDLVLAILRGSVNDSIDAAAWLSRNPVAPPRDYTAAGAPIY